MRNVFQIFWVLAILPFSISGQNPVNTDIKWVMVFDGYNTTDLGDLVVDDEGNTYVGINYSSRISIKQLNKEFPRSGHVGRLLVKLDPQGNPVWAHAFTSEFDGRIQAVSLAPNGDVLIAGFCDGVSSYPSTKGKDLEIGMEKPKHQYHRIQYVYLARYSPDGERVWVNQFQEGWGESGDVAADKNGNVYWSLYHRGTLKNGNEIIDSLPIGNNEITRAYILKLDSHGEILSRISLLDSSRITSSYRAPFLMVDRNDNLLVYGRFSNHIEFSPEHKLNNDSYHESSDAYVVKYDSLGNFLWLKSFEGRASQHIWDLAIDSLNRIHVTGEYAWECVISNGITATSQSTYEYKSGNSFFYALLAPDGKTKHVRFHTSPGYSAYVNGKCIGVDPNGYVHLGGTFSDTLQFEKYLEPLEGLMHHSSDYTSVWKGDTCIGLSTHADISKAWAGTTHLRCNGGIVVFGGIYYGPSEIIGANGKKFELTHKDHGRSTYIASYSVPDLESLFPSDSINSEENTIISDLNEMLACLSPKLETDPTIWYPVKPVDQLPDSVVAMIDYEKKSSCGVRLKTGEVIAYPNPTQGQNTLRLKGFSGLVNISILSAKGDLLLTQKWTMKEMEEEIDFNLSGMADGLYYFVVTQHSFQKTLRVIKAR